ncbi:bifunctional diguanylate cyclase/phosphodiesterase [Phytohabitans sp. ZYX-F-186]|uniref:Bifunctional diguanylate cyclase/phosphodiesterase n=1 Tax=Phytohabitans maris TaxID=3071409 RepID=A0ABU0ZKZ5_9ACTN|nr:bifunctional diguanylate cyclase/phosphodiesterase [Phytohabitans sp. ZYX-F-186]MDQ7907067.1 bifunctional diguanylate cyclase/phosphodiesterase [Phytohabitans sp. ZYX-F-186]
MTRTEQRDNETDRRLLLLVGLVALVAGAVGSISVFAIVTNDITASPTTLAAVLLLVVLACTAMVRIRVRANNHGVSWTETAMIVGFAVVPVPWVILATALGVAVIRIITKVPPLRVAFGVGKETLVAGTIGLSVLAFNWHEPAERPTEMIGALAVGYVAAIILDELLTIPILALASRTSVKQRFRTNWDLRLGGSLARFVVAVATLALLQVNSRLLIVIPPVVLSLHLAYSARVRSREERHAWQRLAQATDALNDVDLDAVLSSAVIRAAELFSVDEVEVELHDRPRLVRGNAGGITYDGPAPDAPATSGTVIPRALEGHEGSADVGELRLRVHGAVKLSERESYTLRTFASALCTAVRNASAYEELTRVAAEHARAAAHDALTGLANRRQLLEHGTELFANRHVDGVTALVLIDLNHFKEINDTLGHAAGDRVLVEVASRLRREARTDDLVARLGGDEFAVLITGLPAPAIAAHRAEGLLAALHEPMSLDGMRISVEASGGIAVAPGSGGMSELLRRADVAMYQAKRSGQRTATYVRARDTADVGRLALGGDLPRALTQHEFSVTFQPIVDLGSGEVVGAEALARWHHPDRGSLDPRRFLETVERSGLLPAFADAVLDQSLIAAGAWRDAGFDLPVAVNVSPRSLLDPRFPSSVVARLRAHDLPPDRLFLELTETLTISQLEVVDQVLGQLRDAGVRLALDDFGTGYSSLSVLSRIPVHELKIDRGFVHEMETSPEATAVIRSTLDLGRSLDLVVVAEGVESEPQRRALWEMGCTAGQGHLFARPMPSARLLAALHRGSGGRPGTLAPALHDEGSVIRLSPNRRPGSRGRGDRLPHLPA